MRKLEQILCIAAVIATLSGCKFPKPPPVPGPVQPPPPPHTLLHP